MFVKTICLEKNCLELSSHTVTTGPLMTSILYVLSAKDKSSNHICLSVALQWRREGQILWHGFLSGRKLFFLQEKASQI